MDKKVFREERLRMIMELIWEEKRIGVNELSERFEKSPGMIRLDLAELEERGLISRTHGGAILIEGSNEDLVLDKNALMMRADTKKDEKQRMGKAVLDLIQDGDSILIDGGTTTYYVAKQLHNKRNLKIITTSMFLYQSLWEIPDATIYLTGGVVHREYQDTYGDITIEALKKFSPDKTIMGIDGVSIPNGFTTTEPNMAMIKRQMVATNKNLIVVADSSKFGKVCLLKVTEIHNADVIVTDKKLSEIEADKIRKLGPKVILA